jgi:hypothetical protein
VGGCRNILESYVGGFILHQNNQSHTTDQVGACKATKVVLIAEETTW